MYGEQSRLGYESNCSFFRTILIVEKPVEDEKTLRVLSDGILTTAGWDIRI